MAELAWGAASHEGQLRAQNEDNFHVGGGLFVVADGMGGHLAGEVASEMAVTRLRENLPDGASNSLDDLVRAVDQANGEIFDGSMHNVDQAGMGTTITAIAVVHDPHDGEAFGIANVGDSRCYVMRHSRLRQVTIDHSFVQELVAEGAITRDEARTHPRRNIVTRALGIEPSVRVDSWTMPIFRGDRFVLCSDGLVDEITDDEIGTLLRQYSDPEVAAQALVDAANAAGGRDNVTVVVVDVLAGDDPPDPTQEFDVVPLWADDDLENTGETQIIADPLPDDDDDITVAIAAQPIRDDTADGPDTDDSTVDPAAVAAADDATTAAPRANAPAKAARPSRGARVYRFIITVGVAAVVVLGFAILAAWARSGYYVAFDDADRVVIYQGREDGFLWFDPTVEAVGQYTRDELDDTSVALVESREHFESQDSAAEFVASRLKPKADGADSSSSDTAPDATTPSSVPPDPTGTTLAEADR